MDPGALDVLHDPGHERLAAVRYRVDLDLFAAQVLVDENAPRARFERRPEVPLQVLGSVRDLHAPTSEHVARADENGVADLRGDRERLGRR